MRRALGAAAVVATLILVDARPVAAHPLGNFTVNRYHGFILSPSEVRDTAVVDSAEIPTAQAARGIDADGDGTISAAERAAHAKSGCAEVAGRLHAVNDTTPLRWEVRSAAFTYGDGVAGLRVSRLVCELAAQAELARPAVVSISDDGGRDRVGWHEMTARGDGVQLERPPVPAKSISQELRRYPDDLLSSPLDVRSARLATRPGDEQSAGPIALIPRAGPIARVLGGVESTFQNLVGRRNLTLPVGLAAVALALLLGASHAALPGHGKTVMAAYIAGRRGSLRDAVLVGATVTLTHTAGVIALGLALSVSASLAGEAVLRLLGVVSGLIVASIGVGLLVGLSRRRRPARVHAGEPHAHVNDHGHSHGDGHAHHHHGRDQDAVSRRGLVGMGMAGGLVPSPSALVVLLSAIALGRTVFGLVLVACYGLGMAATLIAAGFLLVSLRQRFEGRARRAPRAAARVAAAMPIGTAVLVLVVGLGLTARGMAII